MQLVKLYIQSTVQTVIAVPIKTGESDQEIEARIAAEFDAEAEEVMVASRAPASDVIEALSLNPGDIFADG